MEKIRSTAKQHRKEVINITKTVSVYINDEDSDLLKRIDKDRSHISRSTWLKVAAEYYLDRYNHSQPSMQMITPDPIQQGISMDGIANFLDSF